MIWLNEQAAEKVVLAANKRLQIASAPADESADEPEKLDAEILEASAVFHRKMVDKLQEISHPDFVFKGIQIELQPIELTTQPPTE